MTVTVGKDGRIGDIIQQVISLIIMDAEALFLNDRIIRRRIYLKAGGKSDWPKRTMRSDRNIERFGHSEYFLAFRDASRMGQVGLNNIDYPILQQIFKIPA